MKNDTGKSQLKSKADEMISLLKDHTWNEAVRLLKKSRNKGEGNGYE